MSGAHDRRNWVGWLDSPVIVGEHVLPLIAGGPSEGHWVLDCFSQYPIRRDGAWLSINCGGGAVEFLGAQRGLFDSVDGFDPSLDAIAAARSWATFHQVAKARFEVGAVATLAPAAARYDVVLSQMSLHRLPEFPAVLERLQAALAPGGWLLLNEYVGPRYFQYTDGQLAIVDELLARLPPRLRANRLTQALKIVQQRMPVEHFLRHAPDEAVSSEQIVAEVRSRFELVSLRPYGGTILEPLLQGIVGNFDPDHEEDLALLRILALVERLLLEHAVVPADFAVIVARKS